MRACGAQIIVVLALAPLSGWAATADSQVVETVLAHFARRADTMALHEDGIVLIDRHTVSLTPDLIRLLSTDQRPDRRCEIAPSLLRGIVDRNGAIQSTAPLLTQSSRWRIIRQGEEAPAARRSSGTTAPGERIRSFASLTLPSYSTNGNIALVLVFFRWSIHDAMAAYVTRRNGKDAPWSIKCSELVFTP
jgi:hypothetical protein